MALKSFRARLEAAKQSDSFWFERAKNDFAVAIGRLLRTRGMTQVELAQALEVAPALVSKTLRGDSNVTIETMVKYARAAGGSLELRVVDRESAARWADVIDIVKKRKSVEWGKQIPTAPATSFVEACRVAEEAAA